MRNSILFLSILFLWTCGGGGGSKTTGPEEPPIVINLTSLTGQAQKGPFNNGTSINVAELSNTLSPTGRNFSSAITDNTGRFSVANVQLESPYVELRANGFYFNEVSNELSEAQLTLYALSNLTGKSSLNVNIITHLEKNRMVTLMSGDTPKTFAQAKLQAQEEVFAIFDYSRANVPESELLDISQGGAANGKLLAMSAILQGDLTVAQMSQLLANISTDIASDGTLDDTSLRATLINNSKNLDMAAIRVHIEDYYISLGVPATIPDFETEINQFLKPPVSQDISASTTEDTAINITLSAADPEGESLTYTILEVNNATVTLSGNVANYAPDANFNGTDTFTYKANDGTSDSNIATVTMSVSAEDDEPNTNDVSTTTDEDVTVVINLTADEYDGENYSFAIISDVSNGTTSLNGTQVTYTPNQDWHGTDTFTFEATDDRTARTNVATATITVNPVNDAPIANDVTTSTDENLFNRNNTDIDITYDADNDILFNNNIKGTSSFGNSNSVDITLDGTDVDGDNLTYSVVATNNGSVTINGAIATYEPTQDWNGEDTFTYNVNDGTVDSNTATVTITVNSIPDAPVISDSSFELDEDSTTADGVEIGHSFVTDVDETTDGSIFSGTVTLVSAPEYGSLSQIAGTVTLDVGSEVISGNSVKYHPNQNYHGTDSFTWKANDGTLDSDIATVTLTINPVNDAPITFDYPSIIQMDEESSIFIDLITIDPDGTSLLNYSFQNAPSNSNYIWGHAAHYFDINDVQISEDNNSYVDILFGSSLAGDGEVALRFIYSNQTWSHQTSDFDDEWSTLDEFDRKQNVIDHMMKFLEIYPWVDTYVEFKDLFSGTVVSLYPQKIYWTAGQDVYGTEAWSYKADDSSLESNASTITIQINNINDAPVANDITSSVDKNWTGHTVKIKGDSEGGSDVDGDALTFSIVTPPSNGSIYNDAGGGIPAGNALAAGDALTSFWTIYNPNTDFVGTDTFTFRANDGTLSSNTGTVTMSVRGVDITMPNDEYTFLSRGETYSITWDGYLDDVGIALYSNDNKVLDIASNLGSVNSYSWTVPSNLTIADNYKIKVYPMEANESLSDFSDHTFTANPTILAEAFYGNQYSDDVYARHIQTSDGAFVLGGNHYPQDNLGQAILRKFDQNGTLLWENLYGNTGWNENDWFYSIIETQDGNLVATGVTNYGNTFGDVFVVKTDANGNEIASTSFGSTRQYTTEHGKGISELDNGDFLVVSHYDSISYEHNRVIKFDENLNYLSHVDLEDNESVPHGMSEVSGGHIIYGSYSDDTGLYLRKIDDDANIIWETTYNVSGATDIAPTQIIEVNDGSLYLVGYHNSPYRHGFSVKFDSNGNEIWTKTFMYSLENGMNLSTTILGITEISDGGFLLSGNSGRRSSNSYNDYSSGGFIVKLNSSFEIEWKAVYEGGPESDALSSCSEVSSGVYTCSGSTNTNGSWGYGATDTYMITIDEN